MNDPKAADATFYSKIYDLVDAEVQTVLTKLNFYPSRTGWFPLNFRDQKNNRDPALENGYDALVDKATSGVTGKELFLRFANNLKRLVRVVTRKINLYDEMQVSFRDYSLHVEWLGSLCSLYWAKKIKQPSYPLRTRSLPEFATRIEVIS